MKRTVENSCIIQEKIGKNREKLEQQKSTKGKDIQ